jgi:hypothetical protein
MKTASWTLIAVDHGALTPNIIAGLVGVIWILHKDIVLQDIGFLHMATCQVIPSLCCLPYFVESVILMPTMRSRPREWHALLLYSFTISKCVRLKLVTRPSSDPYYVNITKSRVYHCIQAQKICVWTLAAIACSMFRVYRPGCGQKCLSVLLTGQTCSTFVSTIGAPCIARACGFRH